MTTNNNKSAWQSALAVAGMAAAGTLVAKLVQVGVDALFANKGAGEIKRTAEWVNSARLMAAVTRISIDTIELAYIGKLDKTDSITATFRALRERAADLERSLEPLQAMSEDEFLSFKAHVDIVRADAGEFEKALRNAGLVEAVLITEQGKEESHVEATAEQPTSDSEPKPVTRTEEDLA